MMKLFGKLIHMDRIHDLFPFFHSPCIAVEPIQVRGMQELDGGRPVITHHVLMELVRVVEPPKKDVPEQPIYKNILIKRQGFRQGEGPIMKPRGIVKGGCPFISIFMTPINGRQKTVGQAKIKGHLLCNLL